MKRTILTRDDAERIATKLRAEIKTRGGPHAVALIWHEGVLISQFGIRRGSRRDQGHDYIPRDLHVTSKQGLFLAQCPMSHSDWIELMRQKGYLPKSQTDVESGQEGKRSSD
jgi:hypothetical protein